MTRATELEALAERVAVIEAENEMLRRQSGWLYRKWKNAEDKVKRLETGKVQPPIEHGRKR